LVGDIPAALRELIAILDAMEAESTNDAALTVGISSVGMYYVTIKIC
jgi:hypothetical protein